MTFRPRSPYPWHRRFAPRPRARKRARPRAFPFPPSVPRNAARAWPAAGLLLGLLLFGPPPARAQPPGDRFDVFIVENPLALKVYNRYQQALTPRETRLLRSYVPMRIIEEKAFLSDRFTRCMTVQVGRSTFYLLRRDDGTLINLDLSGFHRIFRNCTALSDTVEIRADRALSLSLGEPKSSWTSPLKKGVRLHRLFRCSRVDYVNTLQRPAVYGWASFSSRSRGRRWRIVKRTVNPAVIPLDLRRRIRSRMRAINEVLQEVFNRLNQETGRHRPAPQWKIEDTETRVTCTMDDRAYVDQFSETIQYVLNELESMVTGTRFGVAYRHGVITIRSKRRDKIP